MCVYSVLFGIWIGFVVQGFGGLLGFCCFCGVGVCFGLGFYVVCLLGLLFFFFFLTEMVNYNPRNNYRCEKCCL